jgi:malonyl-CoA/methylmalonyl-CoA synthetase
VNGAIGAVQIRGPNVFAGYWRMEEKTREEFTADGFFRTGDIGQWMTEGPGRGYLRLVGRAKDLIITGGLNVYPKEIEERIDQMDGVEESAVVGIPDADFGETVAAIIVVKPGQTLTEASIINALKREIAHFKVPKRVYFASELPRNAMGKVQKAALRQKLAE